MVKLSAQDSINGPATKSDARHPNVTGDQELVDEAVNASQDEMSGLDYHRVMPFKASDDGPQMTVPVD